MRAPRTLSLAILVGAVVAVSLLAFYGWRLSVRGQASGPFANGTWCYNVSETTNECGSYEANPCIASAECALAGGGIGMCRYYIYADAPCDDANPETINDKCNNQAWSTCQGEPDYCGSGIQTSNEQCDDGNAINGDGCSSTCINERCGDGIVSTPPEACDDGNTMNGDGCSSTCTVENGFVCSGSPSSFCTTTCGDGICVDPQEVSPWSTFACNEDCSVCGDGRFNVYSEHCDESAPDTGCAYSDVCQGCLECVPRVSLSSRSSSSRPPSVNPCGNGLIQEDLGEQCDDGNRNPGDGCDPYCYFEESVCGDGTKAANEECDPSETSADQQTLCADRLIVPREEAYCFNDCTCGWAPPTEQPPQECGNGEKNNDEECDYGENGYDAAGGGVYCKDEQQGPCCTTSCRLTQCSDGEDNDGDDATDDEDLGCSCADCALAAARDGGEPPAYDPTRDDEYDMCSAPLAQNADRSSGFAWLRNLWGFLVALEEQDIDQIEKCYEVGKFPVIEEVKWKNAQGQEMTKEKCEACQEMPKDACPAHLQGRTFINAWASNACDAYADANGGGTKEEQREYCVASLLCRCDPQAGPISNTTPDGKKLTDLMGGSPEKCYLSCLWDINWEFPGAGDPNYCRGRCIMTFCPLASSSSRASSVCPPTNPACRPSSLGGPGGNMGTTGGGASSSTNAATSAGGTTGNTGGTGATGTTGTTGGPGGAVSSLQASSVPAQSAVSSRQSVQSSSRPAQSASSRPGVASSVRLSVPSSAACPANPCAVLNGAAFCGAQGQQCQPMTTAPCFSCVRVQSSVTFSVASVVSQPSSAFVCPADSCASGGAQYCAATGRECRHIAVSPCFECMAGVSSSPALSSQRSASSMSLRIVFSAQSISVSSLRPELSSAQQQSSVTMQRSSVPLVAQAPVPVDVLPGTSVCGNGIVETGEECDDANTRDYDGCNNDCLVERGYCGDGVVQLLLGEQCEPRAHDSSLPYGCSPLCRFLSSLCGNGVLDEGEQCDQGVQNSGAPNAYCRTDCGLARCGDGIVDGASETCDDGNRLGADGCSSSCAVERAAPSPLTAQMFLLPRSAASAPTTAQPYVQLWQATPPQTTASGPGALAIMAAGAGAGLAYVRRKKRQ